MVDWVSLIVGIIAVIVAIIAVILVFVVPKGGGATGTGTIGPTGPTGPRGSGGGTGSGPVVAAYANIQGVAASDTVNHAQQKNFNVNLTGVTSSGITIQGNTATISTQVPVFCSVTVNNGVFPDRTTIDNLNFTTNINVNGTTVQSITNTYNLSTYDFNTFLNETNSWVGLVNPGATISIVSSILTSGPGSTGTVTVGVNTYLNILCFYT